MFEIMKNLMYINAVLSALRRMKEKEKEREKLINSTISILTSLDIHRRRAG